MALLATGNPPASTARPVATLFDRYQLGTSYSTSQQEYQKKQERCQTDAKFKAEIAPYTLHHLFACKAVGTIPSYLGKQTPAVALELVNRQELIYKLTCLHITVCQGNVEGTRELIRRGADVNLRDKNGFTPWLHTALLVDYTTLKNLLEQSGATKDQAQWDQLRKSAGFEPDIDCLKKCIQRNEKGENLAITPADWTTTFRMERYSDSVVFEPTHHQHLWRLFFQHSFRNFIETFGAYTEKTLHPVQLAVQDSLGVLPGVDAQRSRGLFLCEAAKQGDFAGWYGAKAIDLPSEPKLFQWQIQQKFQQRALVGDSKEDYYALIDDSGAVTADAYHVGNALRFANDGWPVLIVFRFLGQRLGMFFIQAVSANTELTWNYGLTNVRLKWGNYKLLHKPEMISFLKGQNLTSLLSRILQLREERKKVTNAQDFMIKDFEVENYEAKLKFIFETPLALIFLCINNAIQATEAIDLLKSNQEFRQLLQVNLPIHIPHYLWIAQMLVLLQQIQGSLKQIPPAEEKMISAIQNFFNTEIIDYFAIPHVVKAAALLRDYLKLSLWKKSSLEKDWEDFKTATKQSLQQYSLEKDKEPPLAFFTSDQKFIVLLEEGTSELLHELGSLNDVERASTRTNQEQRTPDWCESYTIRTYKNFVKF